MMRQPSIYNTFYLRYFKSAFALFFIIFSKNKSNHLCKHRFFTPIILSSFHLEDHRHIINLEKHA